MLCFIALQTPIQHHPIQPYGWSFNCFEIPNSNSALVTWCVAIQFKFQLKIENSEFCTTLSYSSTHPLSALCPPHLQLGYHCATQISAASLPSNLPSFDYRFISHHENSSFSFSQMLSLFYWDTCISACHSNSLSSCGLDDCKNTCSVSSCSLPLYLLQPLHFLPVGSYQPIVVLAVFLWLLT